MPTNEVADLGLGDTALFERCRNPRDPVDRDAVVERFLPLARQIAARYERPGEAFDDLFQVACFGLVKAVDRFDPARRVAFSTYAVPTITGEIKRYFRDRAWSVRVRRELQERALRVEHVVGELTRESGRQPSVDEVARSIGIEAEDVLEAMQAAGAYRAMSLDAPHTGDEDAARWGHGRPRRRGLRRRRAPRGAADPHAFAHPARAQRHPSALRVRPDPGRDRQHIGVSQVQVSRILRHSVARLGTIAETHG